MSPVNPKDMHHQAVAPNIPYCVITYSTIIPYYTILSILYYTTLDYTRLYYTILDSTRPYYMIPSALDLSQE